MKSFLHIFATLVALLGAAAAQNYQTQTPYPSDPYSGTPQPTNVGGYESYSYKNPVGTNYSDPYAVGGGRNYGGLLTWGQLEVYYAYSTFDVDDLEGSSGLGVDLRLDMMKVLFLHFGLDRLTSSDAEARDLEVTTFVAGAGAFLPLGSRFQIYGEVGLRFDYASGDLEEFSSDDIGVYFRPGVRFAVTDKFELTSSVLFNNTENWNDLVIEFGAYYALLSWLDIGAGVDFGSDVNTYRLGGRWRWD